MVAKAANMTLTKAESPNDSTSLTTDAKDHSLAGEHVHEKV
jgi:hypothetical protein